MIWYACKKCGKRQGRPDTAVGTLVFCECGQGNRVPWSSTIPEPEVEEAEPVRVPPRPAEPPPEPPPPREAPPPPRSPESRPPPRDPIPRPEWYPPPRPGSQPPPPRPFDPPRSPRRVRETRRINPAYCLAHDDRASTQRCDDCRCSFCDACVTTLVGKTLCGPCKNFRARGLQRAARTAPLVVLTLVAALVTGPLSFCLSLWGVNSQAGGSGSLGLTILLSVLGALLPAGGLVLGCLALRDLASRPHVGGRLLALTGSATALVGLLWSVTVGVLAVAKQWQG
jgi:hypothetical protein